MFRSLVRHLSLLATLSFVAALPSRAGEASSSQVIAHIYDGDRLVADVIKIGKRLGKGGVGETREVILKNPKGNVSRFAMKTFHDKFSEASRKTFIRRWSTLSAIADQDTDEVLANAETGLKLVFENQKNLPPVDILLSVIASGSADQLLTTLKLKPNDPALEAKIAVITKFKRQVFKGIDLLASNGLTHGDIKPSNVLFTTDESFNWNHPDPAKIDFKLADFDSLVAIGEELPLIESLYGSPEAVLRRIKTASPAYDLYSHAIATYIMAFNDVPFRDYSSSAAGAPLREKVRNILPHTKLLRKSGDDFARSSLYRDPQQYEKYLQWIDDKFRELDRPDLSKTARANLNEIRIFVLNGLTHSPTERMRRFPKIYSSASSSSCPDMPEQLKRRLSE